jgi:hypothetical protein
MGQWYGQSSLDDDGLQGELSIFVDERGSATEDMSCALICVGQCG